MTPIGCECSGAERSCGPEVVSNDFSDSSDTGITVIEQKVFHDIAPLFDKGLTFPLCCFDQISCWFARNAP